jgi:photosystem II stability/assembly factor-like uncharacterized protein
VGHIQNNGWWRVLATYGIYGVHFTSSLTGFVTSDSQIFKTTDGGYTWYSVSNNVGKYTKPDRFKFLNAATGFFIRGDKVFLRTADGGESWSEFNEIGPVSTIAILGDWVFATTIHNDPLYTNVWKSKNGEDWEQILHRKDFEAIDFAFSPLGTLGIIVGAGVATDIPNYHSSLLLTRDGGITWSYSSTSCPNCAEHFNDVSIPSESVAIVLGHDAGWTNIFKYSVE